MKNFRYNSMILIMLIATLLPFGSFASASDGEGSEITVTIDGRPIYFDVAPKKIDGRVMVPLRAIFEGLGAEVGWEESTQTITGTKDGTVVTLRLNDTKAEIDGKVVRLDVAATKINGRTLVPARFVVESFGAEVQWDESRNRVVISTGAAAPEGRYYFVYNSQKVTAEDLAAIKLYVNKFRDTYNVLFDSSKYRTVTVKYL
jgi:Copper amine oxidase N-terminal domain.